MRTPRRLLIGFLLVATFTLLVFLFAPLLVSKGVRLWFWWKTHGTNVTIKFDEIEAPFLRPIVLRGVRIETKPGAAVRIDARVNEVVFALNLKGILLRTRGRTLRTLALQGLRSFGPREPDGAPALVIGYGTPPAHAFTTAIARLAATLA